MLDIYAMNTVNGVVYARMTKLLQFNFKSGGSLLQRLLSVVFSSYSTPLSTLVVKQGN